MKILRIVSRLIVGIVFIFSGFVKGIDPLGSTYKFGDYFMAFKLDFLLPIALPLAIFLCAIEFTMGFALLVRFRMKITSWVVMIFMLFFTVLTLILALYNPVSDCGCFGDAIILTNWQTFWKNVIIMAFVVIVFFNRKNYHPVYNPGPEWILTGISFLVFILFSFYNYKHLPIIDFRPYHVGTYIPKAMEIPDDAPQPVYKTIFYYKNKETGKIKKFNEENYPWDDTVHWEFDTVTNKLVKHGYEPPIHDFSITTTDGGDITDNILQNKQYTFLLVSYDLSKANSHGLKQANKIANYTDGEENFSFYGLTSSTGRVLENVINKNQLDIDFYLADEITLKTIVRSNPGLMLIKNGTIIGKWHYNDLPDIEEVNGYYSATLMNKQRKQKDKWIIFGLSAFLLLVIITYRSIWLLFNKEIH